MSNPFKVIIAILAAITMLATQVHAQLNNMTYTFTQVGNDVVITGNGSFNTTGIIIGFGLLPSAFGEFENPNPNAPGAYRLYSTGSSYFFFDPVFNAADISSLHNFFGSSNPRTGASSTDGINGFILSRTVDDELFLRLFAPVSYESGNTLSTSMTFNNITLATWGLEMGKSATFSYSAPSGGSALGTITLLVAIPEPSALLLVGSVVGAGWVRRRRR
jgi:hypothetical protein